LRDATEFFSVLFVDGDTTLLPAYQRYIGMEVYITQQTTSYTLISGTPHAGGGIDNAVWATGSVTSSYALNAKSAS